MRIALNLLFLIPSKVGGTETYAVSLIEALAKVDNKNEYYLLINRECRHENWRIGKNFTRIECPVWAKNRVWRLLFEQFGLPILLFRLKPDVLHSLGYTSPIINICPSVVTIHDLNYLNIPDVFSPLGRLAQRFFVSASTILSTRIIAVSAFTKKQILENFSVSEQKIHVIHEAPREWAYPTDAARSAEFLKKYRIYKPYIFALNSRSPHKNIHLLVDAFKEITYQKNQEYQLVIGGIGPDHHAQILDITDEIIQTGYLEEEELYHLLSNATIFVFPSRYEGFGLPVLEAMSLGVPVICSRVASIPEIAGEGAEFFSNFSKHEFVTVIEELLFSEEKQSLLREKGLKNSKRFSWNSTANETLTVYKTVYHSSLMGKTRQR